MDNKKLLYINFALLVIIVVAVVMIRKSAVTPAGKKPAVTRPAAARPEALPKRSVIYDISQVKKGGASSGEAPKDLNEVYGNFPEKDVGTSMIELWSKVDPRDKAKLLEGLNKQIDISKQSLVVNPNNKKVKSLLAISEALKKLILANFNYTLKKSEVKK